jgi:type III secretory pathway component EscR
MMSHANSDRLTLSPLIAHLGVGVVDTAAAAATVVAATLFTLFALRAYTATVLVVVAVDVTVLVAIEVAVVVMADVVIVQEFPATVAVANVTALVEVDVTSTIGTTDEQNAEAFKAMSTSRQSATASRL